MLLEKEPRHSAHTDAEAQADHASIAEGPFHLKFAKRSMPASVKRRGLTVVGDFFGVLVGMMAFETACTEDMGIRGIDPNALESG